MKKSIITIGSLLAVGGPLVSIISCNVTLEKNQKNNRISHKNLFETDTAKTLSNMLKYKFESEVLNDYITRQFTMRKLIGWENAWDVTNKMWTLTDYPVKKLTSQGNFSEGWKSLSNNRVIKIAEPSRLLRNLEDRLWRNTYLSKDVRSLLNNIKTIYNRNKVVYPTDYQVVNKNNSKHAIVTFRVDLISPMTRRFMDNYLKINIDLPIIKMNDLGIYNMYNVDNPLSDLKSIDYVLNQYFFVTGNENYGSESKPVKKTAGFPIDKWFTASNKMNNSIIDWYSMKFTKEINGKMSVSYNLLTNFKQDPLTGKLSFDTTTKKFSERFDKNDTLGKVASYIEKQMFTNNSNAYIKNLFTNSNGLNGKVVFASLAGTSINGLTISDYTTNISNKNKPLPPGKEESYRNINDIGHINIFVSGKKSSAEYHQLDIPFQTDAGVYS